MRFKLIVYLHFLPLLYSFISTKVFPRKYLPSLASAIKNEQEIRVLLVVEPTPFNYVSGYANRFQETLSNLKLQGKCKFHVVTPDNDRNATKSFDQTPVTSIRGFSLPMYQSVTVSIDSTFKIGEVIKKFDPHLIHATSPSVLGLAAILWSKMLSLPLVLSYHTDLVEYSRSYFSSSIISYACMWYVVKVHECADLLLCTSPQMKQGMEHLGLRDVHVWRKGINCQKFSPTNFDLNMRKLLSIDQPNDPLLLFVGRLGTEKKIFRLRKVLERIPEARLAIVGAGPEEAALRSWFRHFPVNFVGELKGDMLSKAYASSDIFLMASDTETLGLTVMEAAASGVPTIAVCKGGVIDTIHNNSTGYLVENDDNMEEFSTKVRYLIENKGIRQYFGKNAVRWAQQWTWLESSQELQNHYSNLIANHKRKQQQQLEKSSILNTVLYENDY